MVPVRHVHGDQERRRGHKDELKTPETNVGDGEELIVADVLTAGLEIETEHVVASGAGALYSTVH